jgi:hypothetical protein
MRASALQVCALLLASACALPYVEIDESLGTGGSAGSSAGSSAQGGAAGSAGSGTAGTGVAGGGGDAERESACIMYCGIYTQACDGHEANTYSDASDCVGVCANSNWPFDGGVDLGASNSLQCRLTHAQFARDMGRVPHCFHASEFPSMGACE